MTCSSHSTVHSEECTGGTGAARCGGTHYRANTLDFVNGPGP